MAATADILTTIASAERDVVEQIKQLTRRKDELQVELGTVREALEALHSSKRQLQELRAEATGAAAGAEDAPADSQGAADGVADAAEAATGGGQAALEEAAREGGPAQLANRVGDAAEGAQPKELNTAHTDCMASYESPSDHRQNMACGDVGPAPFGVSRPALRRARCGLTRPPTHHQQLWEHRQP